MSVELHYKSFDSRYQIKLNGDNKDLVEQLAAFEEIFCSNTICGQCESKNTRFNVREVDSNKYYERVCNDCNHSFSFGQKKKGGNLFPKTGKGWTRYTPPKDDEEDVKPTAKGAKK